MARIFCAGEAGFCGSAGFLSLSIFWGAVGMPPAELRALTRGENGGGGFAGDGLVGGRLLEEFRKEIVRLRS